MTTPLRVPPGVRVRYVDRHDRAELLEREGPDLESVGLDPSHIPTIDIVDDAQSLATLPDESVDFVVANHVVEHLEHPVGAMAHMLRVTRPGGVVFLTLPDACEWFDARRPRTSVEHLLRDHREGPEVSRREHYEEWARLIETTASSSGWRSSRPPTRAITSMSGSSRGSCASSSRPGSRARSSTRRRT